MGLLDISYLFVVGLLGGIITSLVGGASVVTFPALVAFGLALAYPSEAIVLYQASPNALPATLPAAPLTPSTA